MSDAQQITLIVDGEETKVTTGTTGAELFFERREVVVARVNGELKDLDQELPEGAEVEGVTIDSPDGLNVLRHSTAHVMAQAVQQLRPDAKLGIGPYITDGVTNITVPRSTALEELTREQAVELLAEKRAKGPVKRTTTARKAPARKATAKK